MELHFWLWLLVIILLKTNSLIESRQSQTSVSSGTKIPRYRAILGNLRLFSSCRIRALKRWRNSTTRSYHIIH